MVTIASLNEHGPAIVPPLSCTVLDKEQPGPELRTHIGEKRKQDSIFGAFHVQLDRVDLG